MADNAYQRLEKELAKTACLSEEFKRHILGEAQNVASAAYTRGRDSVVNPLEAAKKCEHANPLVMESWAQALDDRGLDVYAGQLRLLSLAIHEPEEYEREKERLLTEARETIARQRTPM